MKDSPPDILENFQWLHAPDAGWDWRIWVCLVAGVIVTSVLTGIVIRRKVRSRSNVMPRPHLAALRALEEMRKRLSEEQQQAFVVDVSQVVRVYIQARFGLRAPHRATEEFLHEVHDGDLLLRGHQDLLGGFLGQCDLVKFAQRHVVLEQMSGLLDNARRFVESTIPPSLPEAVTGKAG